MHEAGEAGHHSLVMQQPDLPTVLRALGLDVMATTKPIAGGWDTSIWRVEHRDSVYALRVFSPRQLEQCRHEVRVMRIAAGAGIPVPRVHAEAVVDGHPALLLGWVEARTLLDTLRDPVFPSWEMGVHFGRMQGNIHAVSVPTGLHGREHEWKLEGEELLRERMHAVSTGSALLHLDYHPLNVMTDGTRITGVLDWANAHVGDPRADVARTLTILRLSPSSPDEMLAEDRTLRRAFESGWRKGYLEVAGRLRGMAPFYAWAGAVMIQDLAPILDLLEHSHRLELIEAMQRWVDRWKRRAGIREP